MSSEDLSLLSTDYVPSAYELYLVHARIREQSQELRSVDVKIASLEQQLDELRRHRAHIDRSYLVAQSLVAPIRWLPLTVLQKIFALSIPRFHLDSLESDTSEDPLDPREPHPHDVRSALRGVCRRWRDVVDATPSAWSTIALDHRLPDDTRVLERWLSRSGSELIDVYMHPSAWSESLDAGRFQAVLSLVRGHLPHIRLLIAHLRHYHALVDLSLTMTDIFPSNQCTEAPNMEVFGIIGDLDADPHEIVGTIRAPKLSSLILLDSETTIRSFTHASLQSLQRLTMSLSMSASASYLNILAQCSNLRHLHWTDYSDTQQHYIGPDISVSPTHPLLPSLTSLTLRVEVSAETLPLFKYLRGSTLHSISVDASPATDSRPPAQVALTSLLSDSEGTPHLHQLMLTRATAGPSMSSLFSRLPNLTTLHVSACHLQAPFFSTLARAPLDDTSSGSTAESPALDPQYCPRLETLRIHSSHFSVPDLASFLRHRVASIHAEHEPSSSSSSSHSSRGCLTCVEIVGCYDMLREEDRGEVWLLQNVYERIMTFS